MSQSLPIDKQYLISSLKDFDEKILSKKYSNNIEIQPLKDCIPPTASGF